MVALRQSEPSRAALRYSATGMATLYGNQKDDLIRCESVTGLPNDPAIGEQFQLFALLSAKVARYSQGCCDRLAMNV
jgi:hypothetical protein